MGSPSSKQAVAVPYAGNVIGSVFCDSKKILRVDYLPKGQTLTGQYYANLLRQLREEIKRQRPGISIRTMLSKISMDQIHKSGLMLHIHGIWTDNDSSRPRNSNEKFYETVKI